ncbi:hypothetical protein BGX26_010648 [Mortierella sp. AD094]|nr:hypothetical protein BGX26_010648 [Mortierella sp. AD094]
MRTAVFAFFLAMFAMLCSSVVASQELEKRAPKPSPTAAFDATVDYLVKEQSAIVVKAFADACTNTDINNAASKLKPVITPATAGNPADLIAAMKTALQAAVKTEVDADVQNGFIVNLNPNIAAVIVKKCPKKDAACIRQQSGSIVSDVITLTTKASTQINAQIQANLNAQIQNVFYIQIRRFAMRSHATSVAVPGEPALFSTLSSKLKAAPGMVTKACAAIKAKEVSQIKTIAK